MKNIVIIGMPGSGKSTVAALVSRKLGRPLVEVDGLIEGVSGLTISEIFAQWGEESFRALETQLTVQTAREEGQIISTGGGVVLRPENMAALRAGGLIFFLDRPPEAIAKERHNRRPLIGDDAQKVFELYTKRIELYRKYAMYTVKNDGAARYAAEEIVRILKEAGEIT